MKKFLKCFIVFLTAFTFSSSCNQPQKPQDAIIKIILPQQRFEKLKGQYVYLFNMDKKTIIDSILVKKETVEFKSTIMPEDLATKIQIKYWDTYNAFKFLRPIGFVSPYDSNVTFSSFM